MLMPPKTDQVIEMLDDALIRIFDTMKRAKIDEQLRLSIVADRLISLRQTYARDTNLYPEKSSSVGGISEK